MAGKTASGSSGVRKRVASALVGGEKTAAKKAPAVSESAGKGVAEPVVDKQVANLASTGNNSAAKAAAPSVGTKKKISREEIAKRAFEIWSERGGSELENWVAAEQELLA